MPLEQIGIVTMSDGADRCVRGFSKVRKSVRAVRALRPHAHERSSQSEELTRFRNESENLMYRTVATESRPTTRARLLDKVPFIVR